MLESGYEQAVLSMRIKWRRRHLFFAGAVFLALAIVCTRLPLLAWSDQADLWVAGHQVLGAILFVVCLLLWAMLLPTAVPIILAGYFFGFVGGVLLTYTASTSAFILAFLITRHLCRAQVLAYLAQRPRSKAFVDHLESAGWQLVVWMRLSPLIPFHIQNYCYGASSMPFGTCLWATLLGKFPGVAMTVLLGAVIKESATGIRNFDQMQRPWWWYAFLTVAGLAVVVVSYFIISAAKKSLRVAVKEQTQDQVDLLDQGD